MRGSVFSLPPGVQRSSIGSPRPLGALGETRRPPCTKGGEPGGSFRLTALYHQLGASDFHALNQSSWNWGSLWMTRCLHEIPDGVYSFEDYLDGDGLEVDRFPLSVQIEIKSGRAWWISVRYRTRWRAPSTPIERSQNLRYSMSFGCLAGDEMPANWHALADRHLDVLEVYWTRWTQRRCLRAMSKPVNASLIA